MTLECSSSCREGAGPSLVRPIRPLGAQVLSQLNAPRRERRAVPALACEAKQRIAWLAAGEVTADHVPMDARVDHSAYA
jgi:hypothetical protein